MILTAFVARTLFLQHGHTYFCLLYTSHDDENLLWVMQRLIERLHDRRDWLAEHDCRNIDDYNERYPDNKDVYKRQILSSLPLRMRVR